MLMIYNKTPNEIRHKVMINVNKICIQHCLVSLSKKYIVFKSRHVISDKRLKSKIYIAELNNKLPRGKNVVVYVIDIKGPKISARKYESSTVMCLTLYVHKRE